MELIEALHKRRSIKSYKAEPIAREVLMEILDATRYTPSGANRNNWRLVVTTNQETIAKLGAVQPYAKWLASAKAAIAIAGDPTVSKYWLEDCCLVAYSIYLAALAKGVGVGWSAIYQSDNAEEDERRQNAVRELTAIPKTLKAPIVLGLGYPDGQPGPRNMITLGESVFWERYGST